MIQQDKEKQAKSKRLSMNLFHESKKILDKDGKVNRIQFTEDKNLQVVKYLLTLEEILSKTLRLKRQ